MCSACELGTAWWRLVEAETYVGAIDSVYENTVRMLVLILWKQRYFGNRSFGESNMHSFIFRRAYKNNAKTNF
jgi:hypothetical protein